MLKKIVLVSFLLSGHVSIYPACGYGCSAIMYGFSRALIACKLPDINAVDEHGRTALMRAAINGDIAMVDALIDVRASVNTTCRASETALTMAAFNDHAAIVKVLMAAGADINATNQQGSTVLIWAVCCGDVAMVDALIAAKADVNVVNRYGYTALMYAARYGYIEIVEALLAVQADPYFKSRLNIFDRNYKTALIDAARGGHIEIAQMIIDSCCRRLPKSYAAIKELAPRYCAALIEQRLPIECGQEIARWLSLQEILALRLVSTHCLLYSQHKFEKIRCERAMGLKKKLMQDIRCAIMALYKRETKLAVAGKPTWGIQKEIELLTRELERAENFNVVTDLLIKTESSTCAVLSRELSEDSDTNSWSSQAKLCLLVAFRQGYMGIEPVLPL